MTDHYTNALDRLHSALLSSADQDHEDALRSLAFAQVEATLALAESSRPIVITVNGAVDAAEVARQLHHELNRTGVAGKAAP